MKITKFEQSCLLVEMPAPTNRTVLFDPGSMSADLLDVDSLTYLDDIVITHEHPDHFLLPLLKQLVDKFPDARITTTPGLVAQFAKQGITASDQSSDGITIFTSPHEAVEPLFPSPEEVGVHYLDLLTHPGDSHSFTETKKILALPVTAPWGSAVKAINLALELKPEHILPVHDWHWKPEARKQMYDNFEKLYAKHGITFHKLENGEPVVINV